VKLEDNARYRLIKLQMPRIAQKLELFWGCPEFGPYISYLMKDTRGGTRLGFPAEIADALLGLVEDHDFVFPQFRGGRGNVGGYRSDAEDDARRNAPKFEEVADAIRGGKVVKVGKKDPAAQRRKPVGGERTVDDASVLCVSIRGLGDADAGSPEAELLKLVHEIVWSRFERLIAEQDLHKVKTVGELFVVTGGTHRIKKDHLERCARLALAMRAAVEEINATHGTDLDMRAGLHVGPVTLGDVGMARPVNDVWGETVTYATGLEYTAEPGVIQVSQAAKGRLGSLFAFVEHGRVNVPAAGLVPVFHLEGEGHKRRSWWGIGRE
jgi:class 3 adenylate cyclase